MGVEDARWQHIVHERNKKFCKSCRKQGHEELECRKKKSLEQKLVPDGKNPIPELVEGEKETLIKKKGKQVLMAEKEGRQILSLGSGFRKHLDINGVQKGIQFKEVWKPQYKRKDTAEKGKELEEGLAKSLEYPAVEIVGITSKETTVNLETGDPSGKDG
ncbi:unnamed protein product [Ilex paraguariensis]|uniref:Uncharacterized protein n=1 Tax=Ilex paraguariensis TaxID=185542 RepID=A0ABC8TVT2_9AQUA